MGKFNACPGLVIEDLHAEPAYILSQRSRLSISREGPYPSLRYENPISQKAEPLIQRISQGLRFGVSVHIPQAITTYEVQIIAIPC